LAVVNQKGGVGKTTTAVTVAHGLALHGWRVLLVDLDAQGNVADALGLEKRPGLYRLLIDGAGTDANASALRKQAIERSGRKGLDVVLGDGRTAEARQVLAGRSFREGALRKALAGLGAYDLCILDVAPGVDLLQVSALVAATHFIFPVALSYLATVGAADALASVVAWRNEGELSARFLGVLPTFWERSTRESHEQLVGLVAQYGELVWPPVPLDVKAREAPAFGKTLWEYAPKTRALAGVAIEGERRGGYERVLARLMGELS